jgi:hypothetical protein
MAKGVRITPASGKIEFSGSSGVLGFTISADRRKSNNKRFFLRSRRGYRFTRI